MHGCFLKDHPDLIQMFLTRHFLYSPAQHFPPGCGQYSPPGRHCLWGILQGRTSAWILPSSQHFWRSRVFWMLQQVLENIKKQKALPCKKSHWKHWDWKGAQAWHAKQKEAFRGESVFDKKQPLNYPSNAIFWRGPKRNDRTQWEGESANWRVALMRFCNELFAKCNRI